ncbi:MAG: type I restriction-modification system specificity subunit [Candidatus Magnetoglobus multicellularis str. Araruama]|uniref:Type I restriction-modification system specificity subunit n=1 Tax=Candidatus Magnetoglobus multicellularis str. Araruama TaxID=890399 RepID=A0A1V1P098_9BACT|nr:MAG: type I restriction-modification system specificity subunit [Candidatus Magnetoglobus multicellularis str. Araruama]
MNDWKEVALGKIAEITSSKRIFYADYVSNGVPFFRSKEIINKYNKQDIQTELYISEHKYTEIKNKYGVPEKNDILLTSVGTLGIPYLVKKNEEFYFKDGNLTWFRNINSTFVDIDYLYIWLQSSIGKQKLDEITIGSTQAALTIRGLKTVEILLPPLPEQQAIASVLSSLDDKIDLLHRQNKTLEAMAETLFRQWFVEEAEDDWDLCTLKDEFDFTMGQSPPSISFNENGVGTPMYQGNRDFCFRFPKKRVFTTEPKRMAEKYDTLISVRAPVGEQNMANEACCIGRGVAAFRYKNNKDYYTYTYFKLKSLMDEIKEYNHEGTVFGSISKKDFEKIEVVIPHEKQVKSFQDKVKPIDDKVILNETQILSLEKLRDTLLPKLMSGEIRVNY